MGILNMIQAVSEGKEYRRNKMLEKARLISQRNLMETQLTSPSREPDKVRIIDAKSIREKIKEKFSIPFVPSLMSPTNYVKNAGDRFVQENIVNIWKGFPRVPNLLKFEESKTLGMHTFSFSFFYVIYEITSENSYRPVEYVLEDFTTIPWYYAN